MSDGAPAPVGDTPPADTPDVPATPTGDTPDWQAEAEKWKSLARKHEGKAKDNAKAAQELEEFKRQSMTDHEKAISDAKSEARLEALREAAGRLVDAEVRAAATGRGVEVDALLEGIDRSRFVTEDGDVDAKAIQKWVDRVAPERKDDGLGNLDLGQGTRTNGRDLALNGDPLLDAVRKKLDA